VLKPNSEGGGNNLWGEEGYQTLKRSRPNERSMFILMEKINTKPIENILFDCTKSLQTLCDYEISHYGIIQGKDRELTQNETVGHMVRLKPVTEREGGIMAGVGALCSWMRDEEI
jgi:glutathione synthase